MKKKLLIIIVAILSFCTILNVVTIIVAIMAYTSAIFNLNGNESASTTTSIPSTVNLPTDVNKYRSLVYTEAEKIGKAEYTNLFMAIMTQESHGQGVDVFQCSKYLKSKNKDVTVENSIWGGVNCASECLDAAKVTSSTDIERIKIALQGYNFGSGFITWVATKGDVWTHEIASDFAKIKSNGKKNGEAKIKTLGEWAYGDQYYPEHVLAYYSANDNSNGNAICQKAMSKVGSPYVWGTEGPDTFDCSGFVYWCYKEAGFDLGTRTTAAGYASIARTILKDDLQPGDVIFYEHKDDNGNRYIGHVAIYIGNHQIIHAKNKKYGVVYDDLEWGASNNRSYGRFLP